ncbi:MAG: system, cellobiose-specific component [Anaerolineales bacterium]|nr:system, cellobiose-specific component [Anaerolineales bacterium]
MESAKSKKGWADRLADAMEVMAPLFDQPHLASVRDGFVAMMPLLIIGALTLLVLQFPCSLEKGSSCYLGDIMNQDLAAKLWIPFNATYGLLSVFVTISISYALARRRGLDPVMPIIFTFMAFMIVSAPVLTGFSEDADQFIDNRGLFTAIVVAVVSIEVFRFFIRRNLVITMPAGVPPAIANAFVALIPGFVVVFGWLAVRYLLNFDLAGGLFQVLSKVVPVASTYTAVAIAESFHAFLWTMGIHGDLTIGIALQPIWTANLAANAQAVADGLAPTAIYTSEFRSYVVPGGSGATLPLALYFIRSKAPRLRRVGWLGIWPGIFNINEPITFGAPVVFNPVLAIPFILITFLNATVAYLAHTLHLVTPVYITAPWTLPAPILMFMMTGFDWRAVVLAVITEFVIPGVIWWPAFKAWERQVLEKEVVPVAAAAVPATATA